MAIKINETDFVIHFWYAEAIDGDSFLMILRKQISCWRLDWRFRYRRNEKVFDSNDKAIFRYALSGLQVPEAQAVDEAHGAYKLTADEFCINRVSRRVNGNVEKFNKILGSYSWCHSIIEPR